VLAGSGRPTIFDALARIESAFAFATRKRRRFQTAWAVAIDDVVARRRQAAASLNHSDLVGLLLAARDPESGEALSDVEIRDQCRTMIATGHGTTARLLFWATYLLTLDLDQQDRHLRLIA
jgi:cytochrome P450